MPRPRARSVFELGGQWIAEEPGRDGLYRFWNDPGNGRTRRASLGTSDIEDAKKRLAEIVVKGAAKTVSTPLSVVMEDYFLDRTDHLPGAKPARHAGRLMLECWGALVKVSAAKTDAKIKEFVEVSIKSGHSIGYISRNLSVLAAALAHAKIPADIPVKEGSLLVKWPHLKPKPKRKLFEPSDEELARLLRQTMPESLRRWILNSMATLGRPTAVAELTPAARDRIHGLIALNPEGRRQNKKFRPAVREPKAMTTWLKIWEGVGVRAMPPDQRYCLYSGRGSIKSAMTRACAADKADLPRMALYSIRHRGTTVLRAAKVPKEQIDYQLGHVQDGARTTQDYGQYESGYLSEASAALDAWIARVLKLAATKPRAARARRAA